MGALSSSEPDRGPVPLSDEEMRAQLEKVMRSDTFSSTITLQRLLRYIGEKTIGGLSGEIKEYVIGREVLGRSADFDPKADTTVRVYAHRLREKVEAYYRNEGAEDDILLEIPKGHYVPRFSRRTSLVCRTAAATRSKPVIAVHAETKEESGIRRSRQDANANAPDKPQRAAWQWKALWAALILILVGCGLFLWHISDGNSGARDVGRTAVNSAGSRPDVLLSKFWGHTLKAETMPLVTFSNAVFLATKSSDLLRVRTNNLDGLGVAAKSGMARRLVANPALLGHAGPVFFEDVYTGTGEVMAIFYLTQMFDHLHRSIEVERSHLVSLNALRTHDVIFLGSTKENSLLAGLPVKGDFVFAWPEKPAGVWDGRILDLHPRSGEPSFYKVERDDNTGAVQADYALVSFLPGITPGREVVVLGGLTTLGTQGAAEFATSPGGVTEILEHLRVPGQPGDRKFPSYLQAVLKVTIMEDEVLSTHCVVAHLIRVGPDALTQNGF